MNKNFKRKIAKEIIILFSSLLIIGIISGIIWGINFYKIKQNGNLEHEISQTIEKNHLLKTSSIAIISFKDMVITDTLNLTNLFKNKPNKIPLKGENSAIGSEKSRIENSQFLYLLLDTVKYPFENTPINNLDMPQFYAYYQYVYTELHSTDEDKIELKKIYDFLYKNKYIELTFKGFINVLCGYEQPIPLKTLNIIEDTENEIFIMSNKLENNHLTIYSNNQFSNIILKISLIIFTIIYPLRFLVILLKWSIKTIKE